MTLKVGDVVAMRDAPTGSLVRVLHGESRGFGSLLVVILALPVAEAKS